ncbi:MAG: ribonuclease P Rpr2/Rpp21/SNM1 subunit [Candidatus Woesearchaeota archaeon]
MGDSKGGFAGFEEGDLKNQRRIKLSPSRLKRKFCKHCGCYFIPGKNLRVRTREGKLIYYCLECKKFWRMPCKK